MFDVLVSDLLLYTQDLIFLLDTSSSMTGERIEQLNIAMTEAVQIAEECAREKEIRIRMRVIQFSSAARWVFGDTENGVEHIDWIPLVAGGTTDTAGAIDLARSVMRRQFLGDIKYRPVVILITDGQSNDPENTLEAIERLKFSLSPSRDKITRVAIGIGDATDPAELAAFASVGNIEIDDGLKENAPWVFNVDDEIYRFNYILSNIIKSILSFSVENGRSIGPGVLCDEAITIFPCPEDEAESYWEE